MIEPPSGKDLRVFGLGMGLILSGFALWGAWRPGFDLSTGRLVALALAAALGMAGLAAPKALSLPYRGWMAVARVLNWIVTRVLLIVFFLLVITPVGVLRRLFGADDLGLRRAPGRQTYWHEPEQDDRGPERYTHPF